MKTLGSTMFPPTTTRTFMEQLDELREHVDDSDTPKETALYALGFVFGVCLRAGWTLEGLRSIRYLPDEVLEAFARGAKRAP